MMKNKAFTLIELLIVVAIIAILAAIAVPNFLEAQVRAKVSRTKADMRTVKTAMECYYVDNNKYPTGASADCDYPHGNARFRLWRLTTPISYITSIPVDAFQTSTQDVCGGGNVEDTWVWLKADYMRGANGWGLGGYYSYTSEDWVFWPIGIDPEYILVSKGPSKAAGNETLNITAIPYDASNGTISHGEIVSYGPG
jgi:general secretion pathway protein G